MERNAVWIEKIQQKPEDIASKLDVGLKVVGKFPARSERWAIKLNLTYPKFLPGVVNMPTFVEGLCVWAKNSGVQLIFIEGDGGNGSYSAKDAFNGNGIFYLAEKYNMACVSISEKPWDWRETKVGNYTVRLPYSPFFRRKEYDRFITVPLFKNHIFTTVSLGMKNLWGCIPDAYRMYYHNILDAGIVALYKELTPEFTIFDGVFGLRGRGPMDGKPVEMNTLMVSQDVGVGEVAALEIMGVSIQKVRHLRLAYKENLIPHPASVNWLNDPSYFMRTDFDVERSLINYVSIGIGRFPCLQKLIYHSALSGVIYNIVNRLRPNSAQAELAKSKIKNQYSGISLDER